MSSEQNKTIVRRLLEEPWTGNLRVVDELIDRNYVGHDPSLPEPLRGPDGFKENIATYRAAYSDARITVDEQIAEGDKVATRWTGRGKHDGDLMGIGPTGKQVTVSGLTFSRLEKGKVVPESMVARAAYVCTVSQSSWCSGTNGCPCRRGIAA